MNKEHTLSTGDVVVYSTIMTRGIYTAIYKQLFGEIKLHENTDSDQIEQEAEMTLSDAYDMQDKKVLLFCEQVRKLDGSIVPFTKEYLTGIEKDDFEELYKLVEAVFKGLNTAIKKVPSPLLSESCAGEQVEVI